MPVRPASLGWRGSAGAACLFALLVASAVFAADPALRDYIIGPKDVLEIHVYEQPDLQQQVRVSEEGRISLPLIGEVQAAGKTVEGLVKAITQRYVEYIYQPQVSVFIREYNRKSFYMLGEFRTPGVYQLTGNVTLLELITQAGGVTEQAGPSLTILRRQASDQAEQTIQANLADLLSESGRAKDLSMQDGDTVYASRIDHGVFFVLGEVQRPGSYKFQRDLKINVLKAVTLAGGFTAKAAKGKVRITREENGKQNTMSADMGTEIQPNDIIVIPESFF